MSWVLKAYSWLLGSYSYLQNCCSQCQVLKLRNQNYSMLSLWWILEFYFSCNMKPYVCHINNLLYYVHSWWFSGFLHKNHSDLYWLVNPHLKIEIPFSLSVMTISLTSYIQQGQGNRFLRLTTREGCFYPYTYVCTVTQVYNIYLFLVEK